MRDSSGSEGNATVADMAGRPDIPLIPTGLPGGIRVPSGEGKPASIGALEAEAAVRQPARSPNPVAASRHRGDIALRVLAGGAASAVLVLILVLIFELIRQAWPSLSIGLDFFTRAQSSDINFSVMPTIFGTLYVSGFALLVSAPLGVMIAIYLSEIAPGSIKRPLGFLVETLAAVPSIIYGLWGIFVIEPLILNYIYPFLTGHVGGFALFAPTLQGGGLGYFNAGVVLAIMILPTVAAISRDVIMTVPASQREAMLALGATRWETTWKVVIPTARTGIVGAILLALGRAVGETMAVTMVIGGVYGSGFSIFTSGATVASAIVNTYIEAVSPMALAGVMELALILLVMTLALNALARALVWSVNRRYV